MLLFRWTISPDSVDSKPNRRNKDAFSHFEASIISVVTQSPKEVRGN